MNPETWVATPPLRLDFFVRLRVPSVQKDPAFWPGRWVKNRGRLYGLGLLATLGDDISGKTWLNA